MDSLEGDGKLVKENSGKWTEKMRKLAAIETNIENCAAELGNIELPGKKGAYYKNMAYEDIKAAMVKINNLRKQLRG